MTATATQGKRSAKSTGCRQTPQLDKLARGLPRRDDHDRSRGDAVLKKIVSQSPVMDDVFQFVRQVARVDSTVLVTGESGTGKELIAEANAASRVLVRDKKVDV